MSDQPFAPRPTGKAPEVLKIEGYYILGTQHEPMALTLTMCSDLWISIFSTLEKLEAFKKDCGFDELGPHKVILDVEEFLASLEEQGIRVAVDPYKHENGAVRFLEVKRGAL